GHSVGTWTTAIAVVLLAGIFGVLDRLLVDVWTGPEATTARGSDTHALAAVAANGSHGPATLQVPAASASRIVVIDAGHGGRDAGAVGNTGLREKDVTLDLAHRVRDALVRDALYRVDLVRDSDTYMPLNERVSYVNSRTPDVFISIHVNDSGSA